VAYDLGDTVTLDLTVKDSAQALVNASTNVLTITLPDNTTTTPTASNPSTGYYLATYVPTQSGLHKWRWITTGPATGETGAFNVLDPLPPLLLSLAEAKTYLNIPSTETSNDEELRGFLETVTPCIEAEVGPVVRRTVTATFDPGCIPVLPYRPVISLTSAALVSSGAAVDITNLVVVELGGYLRSKTYAPLPFEPWTLTYVVGRPVVTANIRLAAEEALKDYWGSQRGAGGRRAGQAEFRLTYVLPYSAKAKLVPIAQSGTA
jgi:hypothetical protein